MPLSRGKTATASSSTPGYDPANAVDGDPTTRWQASTAADPSSLTIDLGDQYVISGVSTSAFLASGLGVKYKIEYSADNTSWSTYADKTTQFTVPSEDVNTSSVLARYMRITLTATQSQGGSISEFEVFGTALPAASQGKTATASSEYSAGFSAAMAVDGDSLTRWAQQSGASDPQSLTVDLGSGYLISKVNTSAYLSAHLGVKYKIEYSTDNINWSTYADKTAAYSTPGLDTNTNTIVARYVKITLTATQGQGSSINEFQIDGTPYPISQGKSATASSEYSATYSAAMALDGDPATRWAQQSDAPDPQSLNVDLEGLYTISSVNTSARLSYGLGVKYKIEYSTDNTNWSTYADKTAAYSTPGLDTNTNTITARYVKITLTATQGQGSSIYEFQVFGNPAPPISQGKSATASSEYSATYSATKAGRRRSRDAVGTAVERTGPADAHRRPRGQLHNLERQHRGLPRIASGREVQDRVLHGPQPPGRRTPTRPRRTQPRASTRTLDRSPHGTCGSRSPTHTDKAAASPSSRSTAASSIRASKEIM